MRRKVQTRAAPAHHSSQGEANQGGAAKRMEQTGAQGAKNGTYQADSRAGPHIPKDATKKQDQSIKFDAGLENRDERLKNEKS